MPGAEALLRWNHPTLGVLSPGQFIPQAEAFGLSNALGDWALENATRQIGANPFDEPTWVNVNLAAAQIQDHLLPKRIEELLSKYKVQPHQLGVEITESMSMVDTATSSKVLRALQDLGISISMDDFGTGYSSLAQLHRLPVDKLKVDKTFIDNMLSDSNAVRIVEAILAMSKALGLHTVAEGVETQAQFDRMKDLGVDKMQGFGISRPTSWAGLHQFALEWKQGRLVQMSDVPTLVD
jgi:diguanylate cyclase